MTAVGRTASGSTHTNTVALTRIKIYFQRYPGDHGTDAERGISGVAWEFKIDGAVAQRGTTAADGSLEIDVPVGSTRTLEIFGTTYNITLRGTLEAVTAVRGQQRRLDMFGYELGRADGDFGAKSERAVLNFQADNGPLRIDGVADATTRSTLTTKTGV